MTEFERPKLVAQSDGYDLALETHAAHIRRVFGLLCQIYSGGKGIEDLGGAILEAAASFEELAETIEKRKGGKDNAWYYAETTACKSVTEALSIGEDPDFGGSSFAENEIRITRLAAKFVAHNLLDHPGRGSKASMALLQVVREVGEHHAKMASRRGD